MDTFEEQLQHLAVALSDPTRGAIVMELGQSEELTATQLARRLGLTANNVYHHMRVLLQLGVVEPPRAVPGPTYVEKYYRLKPELRLHDPEWLDRTMAKMGPEERKALTISMCLTMSQLLQRAARRYERIDAAEFDEMAYTQQLVMLSINTMGRKRLLNRLRALRQVITEEQAKLADLLAEDMAQETDMVLMAGLPLMWDEEEDEEK